ncbi:hypothetical protein PGT21_022303 [Puccinia graminis f. sp. tritici]|uniref:Uncharacterized protein n=1 Tax=Puccinia graminis f. sp. tritici TaxID=56615 RepID=A0A5B0MFC6_PUCGR|nr:hypothetical protein PGT21_022303 [Puccinia graminis f. sp. tritici]
MAHPQRPRETLSAAESVHSHRPGGTLSADESVHPQRPGENLSAVESVHPQRPGENLSRPFRVYTPSQKTTLVTRGFAKLGMIISSRKLKLSFYRKRTKHRGASQPLRLPIGRAKGKSPKLTTILVSWLYVFTNLYA